jgi:chitin disaccharide deacetylase
LASVPVRRVIINADDLGASPEVNRAIFELMSRGLVTSTTLLANGPALAEAVQGTAGFPQCSFGVHLCLTQFAPLTSQPDLAPILERAGRFAGNAIRRVSVDAALRRTIYVEWRAQVERIRAAGIEISHVDSHHHTHTIYMLLPVLRRLCRDLRIPAVRISRNLYAPSAPASRRKLLLKRAWNCALRHYVGTHATDYFTDFNTFLELAEAGTLPGGRIEVMVHPGNEGCAEENRALCGQWREQLPRDTVLSNYREITQRRSL